MLGNLTEIVGPFETDEIISCATSSNLNSSQISWYSSSDAFVYPLPISPLAESPFIPHISSYPSANGTLLDIHLGFFFQSLDNEAIYLCNVPNQDNDLGMFFITIYSKLPSELFPLVLFPNKILSGSITTFIQTHIQQLFK